MGAWLEERDRQLVQYAVERAGAQTRRETRILRSAVAVRHPRVHRARAAERPGLTIAPLFFSR